MFLALLSAAHAACTLCQHADNAQRQKGSCLAQGQSANHYPAGTQPAWSYEDMSMLEPSARVGWQLSNDK